MQFQNMNVLLETRCGSLWGFHQTALVPSKYIPCIYQWKHVRTAINVYKRVPGADSSFDIHIMFARSDIKLVNIFFQQHLWK